MKRNAGLSESDATGKRCRSSLAFYGAGVNSCKNLSHSDAWHSAKQLVADNLVSVKAVYYDAQHDQVVHVVGDISAFNRNTASFPHLLEPYACGETSTSPAPQLAAAAHIIIDSNTGEVLDANSSCCPGGFQPVLGSLCPCVLAALLTAAKHEARPSESEGSQQVNLSAWAGSTLSDALAAAQQAQEQQQSSQQRSSLQQSLCLVQKQAFSVSGVGLSVWDREQQLSSVAKVHFASQRGGDSLYGGYYASRASHDPNVLVGVEDAESDLSSHQWYSNTISDNLAAPIGFFNTSNVAAVAPTKEADRAAAPPAVESAAEHGIGCRKLLDHVVHMGLTQYGSTLFGSSRSRPKVVNQAFERLTGGADAAPPQPVSAVVLLLRALWEYLHIHGLGRLLAKPLKMLLALRNVLLVSSVPLWLRKSVCCQLDIWEKGLLYQHAASPLSVDGNVGIVHLLRVLQEARQLCLHHWDSPQLAKLLTRATSADQHHDHDHQSEVIVWYQELPSLLQLRLKMLSIVGQHNAYLELAMAGGAWREAISNMLRSKERSQLLRAVSLLPRHISSLSERMSYMTQLLELQSLGAPEKLEVAARLLLAIREQLEANVVDISVVNPNRQSSGPRASVGYTRHVWKVSQYTVPKATLGPVRDAYGIGESQSQANMKLQTQWDNFLTLFVRTAAKALIDAGKESARAYDEYMKAECGEEQDEAGQQDQQLHAEQCAAPAAGTSAAAAAAASCTSAAIESMSSTPGVRHDASRDMQHQYNDVMPVTLGSIPPGPPLGLPAEEPCYRLCASCGEYHRVEPSPTRVAAAAQAEAVAAAAARATAAAGQANLQLLAIDDRLFTSGGKLTTLGYPPEAESGSLQSRSATGYILDQKVVQAYTKVVAVEYPELLPLCSLDALCVATLSSAVMQHFDSNGVLDTTLPLDPLKDLLSHGLVEMGPGPVRVQAALAVAVYATVMTPLQLPGSALEDLYRKPTHMLLGAGQRRLALMAARTRFKVVPSTHAAAELMEVAIACGLEEESAAVDLILGKGLVRDADAIDESILAEHASAAERRIEDQEGLRVERAMERRLAEFRRELMYIEDDNVYGGQERLFQQLAGAINLPYLPGRGLSPPRQMDGSDDSLSDSEQWYSQVSDGDEEVIELRDDDSPVEAADPDRPERRQQEVQRAAAEAAAAAAAAGENPAAAALEAARAAQQQQQQHNAGPSAAADKGTSTDAGSSLNTCDLLGDAAKAIQLQDTASSRKRAAAAEPAVTAAPPAAAAAPPAPQAVAAHQPRRRYIDYDDDSDIDADDYRMDEYRRARPVRDLPPAQLQARPDRAAVGSSKKRKQSASPSPAAAAAAGAGGGGGPPPGGDAEGPGNGRRRSSADNKRRRRSPNHSKDQFVDNQQAELVSDLFGITESSHARPGRTYRIHIRRLSGLQLWPVVKYAAGRGAAADSIRKLGLAAWLSDSTNGKTVYPQTPRPQLLWLPVSVSQQAWLETVERDFHNNSVTSLPAVTTEPYGGTSVEGHCWSGLPSSNWDSFVSQERLPSRYSSSLLHYDTPDAHLAWLVAIVSDANMGAGLDTPATGDAKDQGPIFYSAPKPLTGILGYTWRSHGTYGAGLYKDDDIATPAADSDTPGVDLSAAAEVLEQLASLSKGIRYGLPVLQLCHSLLSAGNRSACLSLLPQGLLPAAASMSELTANSCVIKALHELMPAVAKHGDVSLQVNAVITELLLTRNKVPTAMVQEKEVLSGVLSWWLGLVCALHKKPAEWSIDKLTGLNTESSYPHGYYRGSSASNWLQLQQLLVKHIMPALISSQTGQAAATGSSNTSGPAAVGTGAGHVLSGWQLLLGCDVIDKAHWALKLYLVRVCYKVGLCSDLSTASPLLMPALSAAAQEHLSGIQNNKNPISSISEWKNNREARQLSPAATRARDWVQVTLTWITQELNSSEPALAAAATPPGTVIAVSNDKHLLDSHQLSEFVDDLPAAVLGNGWYGPELLALAATLHKLILPQPPLQRRVPTLSMLDFLEASLLPLVGRAAELSVSQCVAHGGYTEVIRSIMSDKQLLGMLSRDVARNLALTFWHQEGTFGALLKANDMLIKLEGAPSACQVTLPSGTGTWPSGEDGVSGVAGTTPNQVAPSSGATTSTAPVVSSITGLPGLSALHPVLLENLDLVPSRGEEMQAAGLRFMTLQMHAGKGNYEAALESVFSTAENGNLPGPAAGSSSSSSGRLDNAMKVADDVLRLVQENSGTPCIGQLISSSSYAALQSLSVSVGHGDSILAGLSETMKKNILRLLIWRTSRAIIHVAPGVGQRISTGPHFPAVNLGCPTYNHTNALSPPTYNSIDVLNKWAALNAPAATLLMWCSEHLPGSMQPSIVPGSQPAAVTALCNALQLEEESLLWCLTRYARVVTGVHLEQDLCSLISLEDRALLGHLPVLMMGLGQEVRNDRRLMWVYSNFKNVEVDRRVSRYIGRSALNQDSLGKYIAKSTVSEIQRMKATSLPWANWDMGQKAQQAAELAEWLWWWSATWPRIRRDAGAAFQLPLPAVTIIRHPV